MMAGHHGAQGAQLVSSFQTMRTVAHMETELDAFKTEAMSSDCVRLQARMEKYLGKVNKHMTSVCDEKGACPYEHLSGLQQIKLLVYARKLSTILESADHKRCSGIWARDSDTAASARGIVDNFKLAAEQIPNPTKRARVEAAVARMNRWGSDLALEGFMMAQEIAESPPSVDFADPAADCPAECAQCQGVDSRFAVKKTPLTQKFKCVLTPNRTGAPEFDGWSCGEPVARKSRPEERKAYCEAVPSEAQVQIEQAQLRFKASSVCGAREAFGILDGRTYTEADWERCMALEMNQDHPEHAKSEADQEGDGLVDMQTRAMFAIVFEVNTYAQLAALATAAQGLADILDAANTTQFNASHANFTASAGAYAGQNASALLEMEQPSLPALIAALMSGASTVVSGVGSALGGVVRVSASASRAVLSLGGDAIVGAFRVVGFTAQWFWLNPVNFAINLVVTFVIGQLVCCILSSLARQAFLKYQGEEVAEAEGRACVDDLTWKDSQGFTCAAYAAQIERGVPQDRACGVYVRYATGQSPEENCARTCLPGCQPTYESFKTFDKCWNSEWTSGMNLVCGIGAVAIQAALVMSGVPVLVPAFAGSFNPVGMR